MVNYDTILFNVAAFVCSLFLLEFGADKFINHTAIVARRTGIPQAIVGLLTAGAEWEELAVVIASLSRGRSSLAAGNIIGSTISNILGAFSLGLLFQQNRDGIVFDKSSKIYSAILLGLTTFVSGITYFGTKARIFGGILIGIFAIYVGSIAWQISKGRVTAPELSDSDDESSADSDSDSDLDGPSILNSETDPLLHRPESDSISGPPNRKLRRRPHSLTYHIAFLLLGFLGIVLSSYVLAHASSTITEELNLSDMLFGVIILSIATTLPEKFIAVISGLRGHEGILVANTVGGNIFLLSLCMGILLVVTTGEFDAGSVNAVELGVMWGSTLALFGTVWFGGKWCRWIGGAMLSSYLLFLVLEVTVIRGLKQ